MTNGQRVWKRQPEGGRSALGMSPASRERRPRARSRGLQRRHRRDQRLRVRMQRRGVDRALVGDLHDLAEIHHGDAVGDVLHHAEVVRDEQEGQAKLALQILQQVDDLRLHRNVERGDRLVADDEARAQHQRAGDADALPLAAGEFVRETVARTRRGSPTMRSISSTRRRVAAVVLRAVDQQRLHDDVLARTCAD